jgi:L-aspartate oxidase
MEFIQFHPTCLYHPHAKSFLISEAVRGEGGTLLLPDGTGALHAQARRARRTGPARRGGPRHRLRDEKHGLDCVHLDISHQPPLFLQEHFPNILRAAWSWASTSPNKPFPWCPPPTTPAAAC